MQMPQFSHAGGGPASRHPEGPAASLLYDSAAFRVVLYEFRPGQAMPLHRTPSSVELTALEGSGVLTRMGERCALSAGRTVRCAPREPYAIEADDDNLVLVATITPGPNSR